ncbi:hypothetical protein [Hymenobacter sp. PAMC 26628]|uniref:hypothetical protein n=1 Tax=Hymenobacter sp. PAMC 26628 TaxID=1484118 RepID=UPI00076FEB89|nr:hypothetical protein [Hymenobacter sp. PAMC 26628]AMJ64066.1 hypothetical protein AXW84_00450 [Hymenobacter sp. PAMC 26628]
MKTLFSFLTHVLALGALVGLLTACDSTPRERQAVVREQAHKLDTLARQGAHTLARVGREAARYDAANRARRAEPLSPARKKIFTANLLGPYAGHLDAMMPATIGGPYQQLLQQTRARRAAWTNRDWDYARAVYADVNAALARVRLDLPARDELRVRAWQAEFVALQAGHTAAELHAATRDPAAARH